ncbi:hypothetical protein OF83DRAFT_1173509 [Amylostereum chailletii]|nr:hypothetical protein OF83DRAFT_1173509 [Amylostereum chailletii]
MALPNWSDPTVIASQLNAFVLMVHTLGGVWFWEIAVNLPYDFKLIKNRKLGWASMTYLSCRLFGTIAFVALIAGFDIKTEFNCHAWLATTYTFAYASVLSASSLIGIRVVAIWNRSIYSIVLVVAALLALAGIVTARAVWVPVANGCMPLDTEKNLPNTAGGLAVDVVLLTFMLAGLLRRRQARAFGLWRTLWKQGLIWILLATIAEVPGLIFVALNLNLPMNLMLLIPEVLILLTGATRMYRGLTNFFEPDTSTDQAMVNSGVSDSHIRRRPIPRDVESGGISMVPLEVSVHRIEETHRPDKTNLTDSKRTSNDSLPGDYKVQAF